MKEKQIIKAQEKEVMATEGNELKLTCVREKSDFDFDILDEVICYNIDEVHKHMKNKMAVDTFKNAIWIMMPCAD